MLILAENKTKTPQANITAIGPALNFPTAIKADKNKSTLL